MRKVTVWVLAGTALAWIVYDVGVFVEPTDGDTLSEVIRDGASRWAAIPFGLGALLGHWLMPPAKERSSKASWAGLAALVALFGGLFAVPGESVPPLLSVIAGLTAGALLWPLHHAPK